MSRKKIKVALICHVSNSDIRSHISLRKFPLWKLIRKVKGKSTLYRDYSVWNTLLFKEFENIDDIELHAIIPHPDMVHERDDFELNGIFYHCFYQDLEQISHFLGFNKKNIFEQYKRNTRNITSIVSELNPDMVVMMGAEGPFFNLSGLKIDVEKIPFLLILQTTMSDPDFRKYYPISEESYRDRCLCEQALFKHVHYIASDSAWSRGIASRYNSKAIFVRHQFCTPVYQINASENKKYDFVYWAANINKAGDDAIEAFALAFKKNPTISLNMVGGFTEDYKHRLMSRMKELGISENVHLTGFLPSHQDALTEVTKARYALVPIKIDIISSTIREAMILGLPVITFVTHGTPHLNDERETVLLSEIGDYEGMANNMLKLVSNKELAKKLVENGHLYYRDYMENSKGMRVAADVYHAVYEHFHNGTPIPAELTKTTC